MSWKIRHEGSPRSIEGLTAQQVVEGLQDGQWEPTDEVMGPNDTDWKAIESHPQFAEIALEMEPPPRKEYDDETRLDMTPLIDVCLVLLIFFILTASYAVLQKMLEASDLVADQGAARARPVTKEDQDKMVNVTIKEENGKTVIRVEGNEVPEPALPGQLTTVVRQFHKTEMLLNHDPEVPHGTVIAVLDAAKGAGITAVHTVVPMNELK
jgi:biopolymer transport protein ExbD